jgi:hypothetical protein
MPHGAPSFFIALQILRFVRPGVKATSFAASRNAAGAVLRPPYGFTRFCILRFFDGRQVARVKNSELSSTQLLHG